MVTSLKVVAIQIGSGVLGTDVVTLEDENGQLTRELSKNVPPELLSAYKGEMFNNQR